MVLAPQFFVKRFVPSGGSPAGVPFPVVVRLRSVLQYASDDGDERVNVEKQAVRAASVYELQSNRIII